MTSKRKGFLSFLIFLFIFNNNHTSMQLVIIMKPHTVSVTLCSKQPPCSSVMGTYGNQGNILNIDK